VHARAYETVQKLLCHGNYCELILSPVRASFQQPSAVRPWPDELRRLPKHHQLQAAVCRPPRYWPDELRRPPKHSRQGSAAETMSAQTRPKFTPAHDSVAAAVSHKHHSIIRVGAGLIQFVHSRTCSSAANVIPNKFLFQPFHGSHSAQNLFRLRTNSESRHCSLRVLQLVVGEHAASSHAPCAGCGRWRSDRHLSLPPEATGWLLPRSNGVLRHLFGDTGGVQQAFRRAASAPNNCCARRRGKAPASARATCCSAIFVSIDLSFYRWEFRLTLKIIAKTLREVVNRVKFGHQHTRRRSGGEVKSHVVMIGRGRRLVLYLCCVVSEPLKWSICKPLSVKETYKLKVRKRSEGP